MTVARMPIHSQTLSRERSSTGRTLLLASLSLLAVGAVMVYSAAASVAQSGPWYARADVRHLAFAGAAIIVLLVTSRMNYQWLNGRRGRWPIAATALLAISLISGALVFVPGIGHEVGGYHRWIRVGPAGYAIGFQPSELIKFALLIFLAAWLTRPGVNVRSFKRVFLPAVIVIGAGLALVATQDFGTAALIGASSMVALVLAGVPAIYLAGLLPPVAAAGYWLVVCQPHRWARMTAVLDVWSSTNPSAYQPRQSLLAIMTGGWFGKGIGCGTIKLGYLPEDSTDFIFAVLCEEWGFLGALLLLGLWSLWIWRVWRTAVSTSDRFGCVLAGSIGFLIGLQAILHIAVDMVVLPPTGIGLPFVSAGGTSLLMMAAATGMIVSISSRQPKPQLATRP